MNSKVVTLTGRRLRGGVLAIAVSLATASLPQARELDSFTLRMDNDAPAGTDSLYTAGTEFDFAYKPWSKPDDRSSYHNTLALGQWIFTPENVKERGIVEDDRPYAGWSYLRYGQHRTDPNLIRSWQLTLGLVGPSSFAEDIQRAVHDLINDAMPYGWHNQLSDEFGYALEHSVHAQIARWQLPNDRSLSLSQTSRISLGNIDTSLSQGFQLRYGRNQVASPAPDRIGTPAGYVDSKSRYAHYARELHPTRFYWLAGAKSSWVAQNLFLDGNRNGRSHRVDKHPFVHEFETGFAYSRPGFKLSLLMVHRTEEFREQTGGQTFASLSLTLKR